MKQWLKKVSDNVRTLGLFLQQIISHPSRVGALLPSSKSLAKTMARQVPNLKIGLVVELGAGTGAITQALIARGISQENLIIVERSYEFYIHLRKRFPNYQIIHADAKDLSSLLEPYTKPVIAVVSSLPFRSLSQGSVQRITQEIKNVLSADGVLIQFTYNFRRNIPSKLPYFAKIASHHVWLNIPPARVDVYKQESKD